MKRCMALVLAVLVFLSLCACGKSEAVLAVEDKIAALGEITQDSETKIEQAENAYKKLNADEKKQVKNHDQLVDARNTFNSLPIELTPDNFRDYFIVGVEESNFKWVNAYDTGVSAFGSAKQDIRFYTDKKSDFSCNNITVEVELEYLPLSGESEDSVWDTVRRTITIPSSGIVSKTYSVECDEFNRLYFLDADQKNKTVMYTCSIIDVTGTITFD